MAFYTWGNSIWNSKEVMRLTSRGRLGINTTSPTELLDVNGNIKCSGNINVGTATEYSTATKMHIKGGSSGYSQPLVRIEQTAGWDGNYCLQTVGYSDFGGIRINGGDLGNSIFKTDATGDMGLTVNNGNMLFNVNGAERMRITNAGNISCTGSIGCNSISLSNACIVAGNVGIKNDNPWAHLNLGNVNVGGSSGEIVFGKNND